MSDGTIAESVSSDLEDVRNLALTIINSLEFSVEDMLGLATGWEKTEKYNEETGEYVEYDGYTESDERYRRDLRALKNLLKRLA